MKKHLATFLFLVVSYTTFSQVDSTLKDSVVIHNNEFKLNLIHLFTSNFEVSYERIITSHSVVGLSVSQSFAETKNDNWVYSFIPYYRFFPFSNKKRALGFFVEANAAYVWGEYEKRFSSEADPLTGMTRTLSQDKESTSYGLGAAVGWKFMTKSGLTIEAAAGHIEHLTNKDELSDYYPRYGISLGTRF